MALKLTAASSMYLNNAAPGLLSTGYPMSVGLWVNAASLGVIRRIVMYGDTGSTDNYLFVGIGSTDLMRIGVRHTGAAENSTSITTALAAGEWRFLVARFIGSGNRRLAVLLGNGAIEHASNTVSRSPTGLDTIRLGARATTSPAEYWDGQIGEYWATNTDIQPDGAQLQPELLRQLAHGGPFSVPHIASDIVDYRSFRKDPLAMESAEAYCGKLGIQTWTNVNGVVINSHPPLPSWYRRPAPQRQSLII